MKYIVLLGDGMADYPLQSEGGKTPLEISRTPFMDGLAQKGELGLVRTIPEGMDPGSDVANLSVFGYDPKKYYTGRAPIEAASLGLQLEPDDIAFRCNLVTLQDRDDGTYMHDYSAGHITSEESHEIIRHLKQGCDSEQICFYPGVSYRHVMVWQRGPAALKTTPPHDISDRKIDGYLPHGQGAEKLLDIMADSRRRLACLSINQTRMNRGQNPANAIWLWGQGRALKLPSFATTHGLQGSVISAVDLVKGLGISAGLQAIAVPGATGYLDTNYAGKVSAALRALEEVDFVYLHVEAPDEASHKGSLQEKIRAIEDFDRMVVQPIVDGLAAGFDAYRIMVLPDHPTPLAIKTHAADPVPFVIFDSDKAHAMSATPIAYSERAAKATGIYVEDGWTLMNRFLEAT